MNGKRIRKLQQGQGLVEYGLILVLVALVVIVAAFLVGQATQRIYGIVLGSTGGKADSGGNLQIVGAWCVANFTQDPPETGLIVIGITSETNVDTSTTPPTYPTLYASTDTQATEVGDSGLRHVDVFDPASVDSSLYPSGITPTFQFTPVLSDTTADTSLCPTSVTIQDSTNNFISAWPVTAVTWTP